MTLKTDFISLNNVGFPYQNSPLNKYKFYIFKDKQP